MPSKIDLTDNEISFLKKNYEKFGPKYCYEKLQPSMSISTLEKRCRSLGYLNKPHVDYISQIFPVNSKSAYFLGFFFGDGYVVSNCGKLDGINIEISSDDAEDLYDEFMFLPWKITERDRCDTWKPMTKFSISNRKLAQYMTDLGYRNKHKSFPHLDIPKDLLHLYIRGLLDSDGHIKRKQKGSIVQLSNTYDFDWSTLLDILSKIVSDTSTIHVYHYINPKTNHKSSKLTIQNTKTNLELLNYVYKDSLNIGLQRKYNQYLKIKEKYN